MSFPENKSTTCTSYMLQIHVRPPHSSRQSCTVRVRKDTTAALVVQSIVELLELNSSQPYELMEVREHAGDKHVLRTDDCPVDRLLLWPQGHEEHQGYYFTFQECKPDPSRQYITAQEFLMPHLEDVKDLCSLAVINEASILETLRCRFYRSQIYTYASNILISINPFKFLPIYNPKNLHRYENCILGKEEPHIFTIADAAFWAMLNKRTNQCIVISGESGSGKTQSTNFIIHCLTALSRKGCTSGVERTILGAGPVLEAFGNAKTTYNNNSSRFGKFIQVNFLEGGIVRGATIEKYLLEKCRLVSRKSRERNYHVFYYLLVGASQEEKEEFRLLEPENYYYLKQDQGDVDDAAEIKYEFKRLQQAMEMVGFLPATKKQIFSVLSAILYLGNVSYEPRADGDGVTVGPPDVLQTLSELLKVREDLLIKALTWRKTQTVNDVLVLRYSLSEAITTRDSMAKSLYSSLFDWIVLRINHALLNKRDMEDAVPCLSIGVLDIFGFEDFKTNSFEQFCINYANEQLQSYFNQHIFLLEQADYVMEGISWTSVSYTDNVGCINLISKKPTGLLYLLDEESSLPQATYSTLLEKFKRQHRENPFFISTPVLEPAFIIRHYAGNVKYQIKDFREKNTDHVRPDIVALLRSSERGFLRCIIGTDPVAVFRWGILRATIRAVYAMKEAGRRWATEHPATVRRYSRDSLRAQKRPSSSIGRLMSQSYLIDFSFDRSEDYPLEMLEDVFATFENKKKSRLGRNKQIIPKNLLDCRCLKLIMDLNLYNSDTRALLHLHKKKKPPSISAQYQTSLVKLMDTLRRAEPFFVRCIRSNAEKREMQFDDDFVLRQLRYTGMLETVHIKRSGYGAKFTFKEFRDEFSILLPRRSSSLRQDIENLLFKITSDKNNFQIGKTKVFLKEMERLKLQETLHKEVMRRILLLQRWIRACLARKHFLMKKRAIIIVQRSWRSFRASTKCRAAFVIQKAWRDSHERAEYLHQRESLRNLQQLKQSSETRRRLQEEQGSRADGLKGITGSVEMLPPRLDGKVKPLPPLPVHAPAEKENVKNFRNEPQQNPGGVTEPRERREKEGTDRNASLPVAPPKPDPLTEPKADDGGGTLQRSKPANMKEKVEKWRERRSDIENFRISKLNGRGISMSLDNLNFRTSSSESDSTSPSTSEVTLRRRKRSRHKRRLANARSGLMLKATEECEDYWIFPLPPFSPGSSYRSSAPVVLEKSELPDGLKSHVTQNQSDATHTQPLAPEKGSFFGRYFPLGQKKRLTPQDGNMTMAKTLGERDEHLKRSSSNSPTSLSPSSLVSRRRQSIKISRGTRVREQSNTSLNRQITDGTELRHLDEFLGNQMNDLQSRAKSLSETEVIFLTATTQFRDTIKSMYSLSNPQISYKGLLQGYKSKVETLAAQKKKDEVPLVVNLFQSVLDGFIRAEIKRVSSESDLTKLTKKMKRVRENDKCPDSPLDHLFCTYQVNIVQSCDMCGSFIWGMEKACMCSACKMVCHRKCMCKIMTHCSKHMVKKAEEGKVTVYFGVHLPTLTSRAEPVPCVLERMLAHVEMNGLYTEGIYRKSGSTLKAKELHHLLDKSPQSTSLDNYQIHTVTGLIKSWLRELPDPLMTFNLYNDFLYAADLPEKSERLRAIYRKLEELPAPNYSTLERLIFHLVRVAKEESYNRMSASALSIVFAPCILRCPDVSDPLLSMRDLPKTTLCLEEVIVEQMKRFDEKMKEIQQLEHAEALAIKQLTLRRQNTVLENLKGKVDVSRVDSSDSSMENTLLERIRSIKQEKSKLAYMLPDLDTSDNENLDCESTVSSESPLENKISLLDLEGQQSALELRKLPEVKTPQRRVSAQSTCVARDDQRESKPSGRFTDLDIPFIDDDF
ncbi:unconventional myosin-IXb isoform X1 [Tachysurus vachellii]|uniref:unconventional myosin-IXb isoform X1 n=2 Tax=Tachysurus vachellii TaxID=175792 RepID=UPI00296B4083|nr:unconventional myosin-IXb isoform X1 [Tachysurus vachellii]XP_060729626.1 unconventional myosin-IXb isoform X1 [Tachysurus vachellii]